MGSGRAVSRDGVCGPTINLSLQTTGCSKHAAGGARTGTPSWIVLNETHCCRSVGVTLPRDADAPNVPRWKLASGSTHMLTGVLELDGHKFAGVIIPELVGVESDVDIRLLERKGRLKGAIGQT